MNQKCAQMAEAVWRTMREKEMLLEDVLDVAAALMMGVCKHAPADEEEVVVRVEDKLNRLLNREAERAELRKELE